MATKKAAKKPAAKKPAAKKPAAKKAAVKKPAAKKAAKKPAAKKPAAKKAVKKAPAKKPAANAGKLVTFGVVPDRPETGYGYIRRAKGEGPAYAVQQFVEKPDAGTAAEGGELIEGLATPDDDDRIVAAAESAFRANWRLLDGV